MRSAWTNVNVHAVFRTTTRNVVVCGENRHLYRLPLSCWLLDENHYNRNNKTVAVSARPAVKRVHLCTSLHGPVPFTLPVGNVSYPFRVRRARARHILRCRSPFIPVRRPSTFRRRSTSNFGGATFRDSRFPLCSSSLTPSPIATAAAQDGNAINNLITPNKSSSSSSSTSSNSGYANNIVYISTRTHAIRRQWSRVHAYDVPAGRLPGRRSVVRPFVCAPTGPVGHRRRRRRRRRPLRLTVTAAAAATVDATTCLSPSITDRPDHSLRLSSVPVVSCR